MITRYVIFLAVLTVIAATSVLELKHSVAAMRGELARIEQDILQENRRIRMLEADWQHLARPERLVAHANRLGMVRAGINRVVKLDQIGDRRTLDLAQSPLTVPLPSGSDVELRVKPPATFTINARSHP